jgi:hypothetical protein
VPTATRPFSPPAVTQWSPHWLPAYLSNGVIGIRVPHIPMLRGNTIVSGFEGEHPEAHIPSAAPAPYPLKGDMRIGRVTLSDVAESVLFDEQRYDFECGELITRFRFVGDGATASVRVLTFCSRTMPSVVLQEITCEVDADCDLELSVAIDPTDVPGQWLRRTLTTPASDAPVVDGSMHWEALGARSTCGAAYISQWDGPGDVSRAVDRTQQRPLKTSYTVRAVRGRRYRLRQFSALVPDLTHTQPEHQATRIVTEAARRGFDSLRSDNREAWRDLWQGRLCLLGAGERWQAIADAAFYYLHASTHRASSGSTSLFGLAQWHNHHYYYGHVMWDLETFCLPPLMLTAPDCAEALLRYRSERLGGALANARSWGNIGAQFPWESSMRLGEEAAPAAGEAAAYEHHVSLDVALAFARYAALSGDKDFIEHQAWPVLRQVAIYIADRVRRTERGYELLRVNGIAERKAPANNNAYVNMAAAVVLEAAIQCAAQAGKPAPGLWHEIATGMVLPSDGTKLLSHDGFDSEEEAAATPEPLAGLFPVGYPAGKELGDATLRYYLGRAPEYIGTPMLSALYGAWAAKLADRQLSLQLFESGYAAFLQEPYGEPDEWSDAFKPGYPRVGPFFANLGGFLLSCMYGLTGLTPSFKSPDGWAVSPTVLPTGWDALEVERVWIRGRPLRLTARHGERVELVPLDGDGRLST